MKLTEHQDRYDSCVEKRLEKEYEWFLLKLKQQGIFVARDLHPKNDGIQAFRRRAEKCGYVLGMKPIVKEECTVVSAEELDFETPKENKIPWGRNPDKPRQLGKNPPKIIPNTTGISGFGIQMSLAGWKIFLDMTYDNLLSMLNDGKTIEQIYKQYHSRRMILCNGVFMSIPNACKTKGVYMAEFYRKSKGLSDDERQKLFDDMARNAKPRIAISEHDMNVLVSIGEQRGVSAEEVLHELISSLCEKEKSSE